MGEDGKGGRGENKWYAGREKRGMGEDGKGGRGKNKWYAGREKREWGRMERGEGEKGGIQKKKKKTKCTKAVGIAGLLTINDVCHSLHL